jgi:hypothetical protein
LLTYGFQSNCDLSSELKEGLGGGWVDFTEGIHREIVSAPREICGSEIGGNSDTADTDTVSNYWSAGLTGQQTSHFKLKLLHMDIYLRNFCAS